MDVCDVADRAADGVEQGGAAPNGVIPIGHRLDPFERHAVVEHGAHVVKEHGGDQRLSVCLFLLFDHGVEPADGV